MDKADSKKVSATSPLKEVNAVDRTLYHKKKRIGDTILRGLIYLCAGFSSILILVIIGYVFSKAIPHFHFKNLIEPMSQLMNPEGLLGNIINTLYIVVGTLLFACPIGIGAAIYLLSWLVNAPLPPHAGLHAHVRLRKDGEPEILAGGLTLDRHRRRGAPGAFTRSPNQHSRSLPHGMPICLHYTMRFNSRTFALYSLAICFRSSTVCFLGSCGPSSHSTMSAPMRFTSSMR